MRDSSTIAENLSPNKRALFELLLKEKKKKGISSSTSSIPRRQVSEYIPLSFAQQRLWFLDQLQPGTAVYNMPFAMRLKGELNVSVLLKSINEIIRRHEVLRTSFAEVDGKPIQIITSSLKLALPVIDLSQLDETIQELEIQRLANEEKNRSFDLAQGPLVRATLLHINEKEHGFLCSMHHIVSDGWSTGLMIHEFALLYEAFSCGKSSPLPELTIQYADFAIWQREWLSGKVLATKLDYWKRQLSNATPILALPTDRPRTASHFFQGNVHSIILSQQLSYELKSICQHEEVTMFMTLLAAFKLLLYRYSFQEDILVGTPIAGRNYPEIENLIGFFVNTLVLRTQLKEEMCFRKLLAQVRKITLAAYQHQDVPFEMIVEVLQPERSLTHTPLFQVMFTFEPLPVTPPPFSLTAGPLYRGNDNVLAQFELSCSISETKQGLIVTLVYRTDLFDDTSIKRMANNFEKLLASIVTNPDQQLTQLSLLGEAEQQQLLLERNNTTRAYTKDISIHELLEAQVEHTPEAVNYQQTSILDTFISNAVQSGPSIKETAEKVLQRRAELALRRAKLSARQDTLLTQRLQVKPTSSSVKQVHSLPSSLVEIQPEGTKRPFFCVHPAGGSVFCYVELARHLGKDQPFYGLQADSLYGKEHPYISIMDMAANYIEAIRS
ncbi:MAG: condensation domain-containing protein, partial [Acidobacteriota bacterium]